MAVHRPQLRFALGVALLLWCALCGAEQVLRCGHCDRLIEGAHWRDSRGVYCSEECFQATRPVCAVCRRRIDGKYLTMRGTTFCSDRCFKSILPTCHVCGARCRTYHEVAGSVFCTQCVDLPECAACHRPHREALVLSDERRICRECKPRAVLTKEMADAHYRKALRDLTALTGHPLISVPEMHLVSLTTMRAIRENGGDREDIVLRGLYRQQLRIWEKRGNGPLGPTVVRRQKKTENVYLLQGMTFDAFVTTAAHELTHALISERYTALEKSPLWVQEGICQYAAHLVAKRNRYEDQIEHIQTARDPHYGDGFRYFQRVGERDGWPNIEAWIEHVELGSLPEEPPRLPPKRGESTRRHNGG